jgi:hypothetical protein|tara:strand:- start:26557 stop:28002 length:1446 start_codon:yes stop_codon:yes gene_type:complete
MFTFKQFWTGVLIQEAKNTQSDSAVHLAHLEDLAIEDGKVGFNNFIEQVTSLKNYIYGLESNTIINLKVDGAPALFFGADNREEHNGAFFVANKYTYRSGELAHSVEELEEQFADKPGLKDKLIQAFTHLYPAYTASGSDRVYHGDILFTEDSKAVENIDGTQHIVFRPQMLAYAVPVDETSPLYQRVNAAAFGIAVHDSWAPVLGSDSKHPASLGTSKSVKNIDDLERAGIDKNVFIAQSYYDQRTLGLSFPAGSEAELNIHLSKAQYYINEIDDKFDQEYTNRVDGDDRTMVPQKDFYSIVKRFLNNEVRTASEGKNNVYVMSLREGEFNPEVFRKRFYLFLKNIHDKSLGKAAGLKTDKGKKSAVLRAKAVLSQYESTLDDSNFHLLIQATHHMIQIKGILTDVFAEVEKQIAEDGGKIGKAFMEEPGGDGYIATSGEGFVLFVGDNHVKMVERIKKNPLDIGGFSQLNLSGAGQFQK